MQNPESGAVRLGRRNERVKALKRRIRKRRGEVFVDGSRLVSDLVRWRVRLRELWLAESRLGNAEVRQWSAAADEVFAVHDDVFNDIATTRNSQGVLAVVGEPEWPESDVGCGVTLYLEAIQDPGNLGAIIRAAAGLGARRAALSSGCADPFHPAAVRGSAGTVFRIAVDRDADVAAVAGAVRSEGGEVWAAASGGVPVDEWRPEEPLVLVFGAEGMGLSDAALAAADGVVGIPLGNEVESLNVAVAAGILLDRLRR